MRPQSRSELELRWAARSNRQHEVSDHAANSRAEFRRRWSLSWLRSVAAGCVVASRRYLRAALVDALAIDIHAVARMDHVAAVGAGRDGFGLGMVRAPKVTSKPGVHTPVVEVLAVAGRGVAGRARLHRLAAVVAGHFPPRQGLAMCYGATSSRIPGIFLFRMCYRLGVGST